MSEIVEWKPSPFDGSDFLPVLHQTEQLVDNIPVVGRESLTEDDIVVPTLKLLQGQSDEVTEGVSGAQPGKFFLSSSQEVIEPPIRVLVIAHGRSNVLYPKPDDPRYAGLKQCLARDGIEGNEYGYCDDCGLHKKWGDNNEPPVCAESHNFTVLLEGRGPAIVRFKRKSFPTAKTFVSNWRMGSKNLWHHPVEIRVDSDTFEMPGGKKTKFYYMKMQWNTGISIPVEIHRKAYETYERLNNAAEHGRLKTGEENE